MTNRTMENLLNLVQISDRVTRMYCTYSVQEREHRTAKQLNKSLYIRKIS